LLVIPAIYVLIAKEHGGERDAIPAQDAADADEELELADETVGVAAKS
jgi:hypothetical protein